MARILDQLPPLGGTDTALQVHAQHAGRRPPRPAHAARGGDVVISNDEMAERDPDLLIEPWVSDPDILLDADKESGAYHDWKRRTGRTDAAGLAHEMQDFGGDE